MELSSHGELLISARFDGKDTGYESSANSVNYFYQTDKVPGKIILNPIKNITYDENLCISVKLVDDDGMPIKFVPVEIDFDGGDDGGYWEFIYTDENGKFNYTVDYLDIQYSLGNHNMSLKYGVLENRFTLDSTFSISGVSDYSKVPTLTYFDRHWYDPDDMCNLTNSLVFTVRWNSFSENDFFVETFISNALGDYISEDSIYPGNINRPVGTSYSIAVAESDQSYDLVIDPSESYNQGFEAQIQVGTNIHCFRYYEPVEGNRFKFATITVSDGKIIAFGTIAHLVDKYSYN